MHRNESSTLFVRNLMFKYNIRKPKLNQKRSFFDITQKKKDNIINIGKGKSENYQDSLLNYMVILNSIYIFNKKRFLNFAIIIEIFSIFKQTGIFFSGVKKFYLTKKVLIIFDLYLLNYNFSFYYRKFTRSKDYFCYFNSHPSLYKKKYILSGLSILKQY